MQTLNLVAAKIGATAIEFLAKLHGVTAIEIINELCANNIIIKNEYEELVKAAISKTCEMIEAGEIQVGG